jgi:hypothetical protein
MVVGDQLLQPLFVLQSKLGRFIVDLLLVVDLIRLRLVDLFQALVSELQLFQLEFKPFDLTSLYRMHFLCFFK